MSRLREKTTATLLTILFLVSVMTILVPRARANEFDVELDATVDIAPGILNLKSKGEWITAYITLPEGYSAEDIIPGSVLMSTEINFGGYLLPLAWSEIQDGVFMAKFSRRLEINIIRQISANRGRVLLTIRGELVDGTQFVGSDSILVQKY